MIIPANCAGCPALDQLRTALATALRESTEVIAQRDTALGLCKEREAQLATVTAERDRQMTRGDDYYSDWQAERAAHTVTRKALENLHAAFTELGQDSVRALESTRAELAKAEARVKELEHICRRCVAANSLDYRLHADVNSAAHGIKWWITDEERFGG